MNRKLTISVAGKFHALSIAKEIYKLGLLQDIYCIDPHFLAKNYGIPKNKYHNRVDLLARQIIASKVPFINFSSTKKSDYFDLWVGKQLTKQEPGTLHSWNGSSYHTFKMLKGTEWKCCVERSCPHNQFQYDLLMEEAEITGVKHLEDLEKLKRNIEELYLSDKIICPSSYSANSYKDDELIKKLVKIPLGGNYPYKERTKKKNSGLKILMVGNSFLRKGIHYLVEAMKYIKHPKAELWVRGNVPNEYRPRIKDNRIKIFENLSLNELNNLYSSADVFVQSSVDEGFGMTVLEALSYGLPLVVTENVGAKDVLNTKVSQIVPIRNPEAIAKAVLEVKNLEFNDFDFERKKILDHFNWHTCAKRLINEGYFD